MAATSNDYKPSSHLENAKNHLTNLYATWMEAYNAPLDQQSETIDIFVSVDNLLNKRHKVADGFCSDEKSASQRNTIGLEAELDFFAKFRQLKLGGLLVIGFNSEVFVTKMERMQKKYEDTTINDHFNYEIWKENNMHFECDGIFMHHKLGVFVLEIKACENRIIAEKQLSKAAKQLEKSISGLKTIYRYTVGNGIDYSYDFDGIVCMPNATVNFGHQKYQILEKHVIQSQNFRQFWLLNEELQKPRATSAEDMIAFISVLIGYRTDRSVSTLINAPQFKQKIDYEINNRGKKRKRHSALDAFKLHQYKSEVFFLSEEQISVMKCTERNILISGPQGVGKTVAMLLRALEVAQSTKPGRVIIATLSPRDLLPKLKSLFRNFIKDNSSVKLKRPIIVMSKKTASFRDLNGQDDIFVDDMDSDENLTHLLSVNQGRAHGNKSTATIVFTSHFDVGQMPMLSDYYHIELNSVFCARRLIFDERQPREITQGNFFRDVSVESNAADDNNNLLNITEKKARTSSNAKTTMVTNNEAFNYLMKAGAFGSNQDLVIVRQEQKRLLVCEPKQLRVFLPEDYSDKPVNNFEPSQSIKSVSSNLIKVEAFQGSEVIFPVFCSLYGEKINLTSEQITALNSQLQLQFICGPPGTGKTLIILLKAWKQANTKPNGTIFLLTRPEHVPIIKLFFIEMHQSIRAERRNANLNESIFLGNTTGMNKKRHGICIDVRGTFGVENGAYIFGNDDDVFRDEMGMNDTSKKFLNQRIQCIGSGKTICALSDETVTFDQKHIQKFLSQFKVRNFVSIHQLKTVMRGSTGIMKSCKLGFKKFEPMESSHHRDSRHIEEKQCSTMKQIVESIRSHITALHEDNVPNNHIAIITADSSDANVIRKYLNEKNVKWMTIIKQAELMKKVAKEIYGNPNWTDKKREIHLLSLMKKEQALKKYDVYDYIVVDDFEKAFSYEWPYVIAVMARSDKNSFFLNFSASRATRYWKVLQYDVSPSYSII